MSLPYTGRKGEAEFEKDFIQLLTTEGWEPEILKYKYVSDLIDNWREIINERNRVKLNNVDLSDAEMDQILDAVKQQANTPVKANHFIQNGDPERGLAIKRDKDSADSVHAGKEVYLDLFNAREIAGGNSRYQIAEQTYFSTDPRYSDRRGDITLLIDGMPVIQIELKASGVPVSEACDQIVKYSKEGIWKGFMGLIQVFFAISPDDTVYFANAGDYRKFNPSFFFRWADRNNDIVKDWRELIKGKNRILSIPEAHKLIGYYCVADTALDSLKVCRSYQCVAIKAIVQRAAEQKWGDHNQRGGFVWCTTGGGKTMTTFKAGELIIDLGLADKVVFVVDRKTLDTQSSKEYESFAKDGESVVQTSSSMNLFRKLKSNNADDHMILTSIQKISRINEDAEKINKNELEVVKAKRIVFIVDEAHRSQFGKMHEKVKRTFDNAVFFGFTGTPIFAQNMRPGELTTESVFGNVLAVYSLATGIRDGNVLGFWPEAVKTYDDQDLREAVALAECHVKDAKDIDPNSDTWKLYRHIKGLPMASEVDEFGEIKKDKQGHLLKGIEDYLSAKQYDNDEHRKCVVDNILNNFNTIAFGEYGTRFHGILATSSILEAYEYWKLFKKEAPDLHVTSLFDPNTDANTSSVFEKETALIDVIDDYNKMFNTAFDRQTDPDYSRFKADLTARLAHKDAYNHIGNNQKDEIDIVIVVDQLLTGFDSKYVNVLYLDKELKSDNLIQAISRTNRVFNSVEKPWGLVKFFRKPYTMKRNLKDALKLYCQGDTAGVQVEDLEKNIQKMNKIFNNIVDIFKQEQIPEFQWLPRSLELRDKFRKEFSKLKSIMRGAMLQGLKWNNEYGKELNFDEKTYRILTMRFNDLANGRRGGKFGIKPGYDVKTDPSTMEMEKIDADYLESQFKIATLQDITDEEDYRKTQRDAIEEIRKNLGTMSETDQKYARRVLNDIENEVLFVKPGHTFMEYIQEYKEREIHSAIEQEADKFGLNVPLFIKVYMSRSTGIDQIELQKLEDTAIMERAESYYNCSRFNAIKKMHAELVSYISEKKAEVDDNGKI